MKKNPARHTAAKTTTTYTVKAEGAATAHYLFEKAKKNLLNVNNWQKIAGSSIAECKVVGYTGNEINAWAEEGNYLRICIPSLTGSATDDTYDWVKVETIRRENKAGYECIAMQVRQAVPPFTGEQGSSHFFSADTTSTFFIERKRNRVRAVIYDSNDKFAASTYHLFDRIKNISDTIGMILGLTKPPWRSLVKGWLQNI